MRSSNVSLSLDHLRQYSMAPQACSRPESFSPAWAFLANGRTDGQEQLLEPTILVTHYSKEIVHHQCSSDVEGGISHHDTPVPPSVFVRHAEGFQKDICLRSDTHSTAGGSVRILDIATGGADP